LHGARKHSHSWMVVINFFFHHLIKVL
jgi:hypothetical protein